MDDFEVINDSDELNLNEPVSLEDTASGTNILHSPLILGSNDKTSPPKPKPAAKPIPAPVAKPRQPQQIDASGRITHVRNFFTKLHAGAIDFLGGQINKWLLENPNIVIKRTNVVTGEIQGKKTEPNIIITVWYSLE